MSANSSTHMNVVASFARTPVRILNFKVDNLGRYLKQKRKDKQLTISNVATVLELSLGYISRIENGSSTPSREVLSKLCNLYDIDIKDIIDEDGVNFKNIKVGTDILQIISLEDVTYKGNPIGVQDRININFMIQMLLNMDNLEDKNDFMSVIKTIDKMRKKK